MSHQIQPGGVLAIVPARAGSKNPPDKNLLPFRGKPLVVHAVEQALAASSVTRVLVSTDSERIADVSRRAGADVPFLRPDAIAGDFATDLEVFQHALRWLEEHEGFRPDVIVHLRPTSPQRGPELIDMGVELLLSRPDADAVRTVVPAPHTPYKMWRLDGGFLRPLLTDADIAEPYNMPRQALPLVYWQNAYLDVTRWRTVMEKNSMTGERILALVMPDHEDVDIDSARDLARAEELAAENGA